MGTDGYGGGENLALWPPCALEILKAHSSHDAMCHSSVPFRTLPYPSVPISAAPWQAGIAHSIGFAQSALPAPEDPNETLLQRSLRLKIQRFAVRGAPFHAEV